MLTADMSLVERLRKQASAIYIAAEKECADDVSDALRKAADEIERLRHGLTRIVGLTEAEKNEAPLDDTAAQVIARDTLNGHMA